MAKIQLTDEEVKKLADQAHLTLADDEIESIKLQLEQTIEYIDNLDELDTTNVLPTNQTTNSVNVTFEDGLKTDRTFSQKVALENAPNEPVDGKFRVAKILDKGGDD